MGLDTKFTTATLLILSSKTVHNYVPDLAKQVIVKDNLANGTRFNYIDDTGAEYITW